ncbi:hypothetical protein LINPERPRIM_LOCUS7293 [Linum perenne]
MVTQAATTIQVRRLRGCHGRAAGWIPGEDGGDWEGNRLGPADNGASTSVDGRVRVALRVELRAGERVVRCAGGHLADVRGTAAECGSIGEGVGDGGRSKDEF